MGPGMLIHFVDGSFSWLKQKDLCERIVPERSVPLKRIPPLGPICCARVRVSGVDLKLPIHHFGVARSPLVACPGGPAVTSTRKEPVPCPVVPWFQVFWCGFSLV